MEKQEVTVASYNMSFMSDLNMPLEDAQWASETTFLASNTSGDRRQYWKNALSLLDKFIGEKRKETPCVIGLQEMNLTSVNRIEEEYAEKTGSAAVDDMLIKKQPGYLQICKEIVVNETQKPALSIIFDTIFFGNEQTSEIIDNTNQPGRPLLMVLTDKDYLFVNMHGAQNPKLSEDIDKFNEYMIENNKKFLKKTVDNFLRGNGFSEDKIPKQIFIMGDFNDRYDAIKEFTILEKTLKYQGESPKSCCHNWDSSCKEERYIPFNEKTGRCDISKLYATTIKDDNGLKKPMNGEEGFIKNYRYKGDKVFGENPVSEIQIFREDKNKDKNSTESDHELVYATFSITTATTPASVGGKRSSRKKKVVKNRKTKKTRTPRSKKSRKYAKV